jgi:undecaprenyl-diphosphatase
MSGPFAALAAADRWLFLKVNVEWTCALFDKVLPAVTDVGQLAWFRWCAAPAAVALWLWRGRRRAFEVLVVAALAVAAGDLLAYRVIKPAVARPRPIEAGLPGVPRAPINGRFGFPSNHAVNMAAAAAVLCFAYPAGTPVFAGAAALIGYSRIYVGAHYPGDVLGGFALGAALGWALARLLLGPPERGGSQRRRGAARR